VSVRWRLTRVVIAVVALAVVVFGGITYVAIDHTLRTSFHSQLDTLVAAVASAVDVNDKGQVGLDRHDLEQISTIHAGLPFALYDSRHVRVVGDFLPPASQRDGLAVATAAVMRKGVAYGSVAAWESDTWIGTFDRGMILAIAAVGLLLMVIGIALARRTGNAFDALLAQTHGAYIRERRFAADASHELRTPLSVIRAETDLALRRERSPKEYRAAMQSIAREARRLEDLTGQLLAAARSNLDARDAEELDLSPLVDDVADRVRPAAEVRDITVRVSANGAALARANRGMIERALLAVAHNAIAHAKQGGTVELSAKANGAKVNVTVADDGDGFSAEALQHATERFWRGDAARSRGGTGLGLSIARSMVEANGGTVAVSNRQEGGALVTFSLPQAGDRATP
jgi:signal transduction histidine kinase